MSAANPSYDLDALHRAQRAYEPSMEEILASIRNIISEERPGMGPLPSAAPRSPPTVEPVPPPPPLAERPQVAERPPSTDRGDPVMPRVVWPKPEAEAVAAPEVAPVAAAHPVKPPSAPEPAEPRQPEPAPARQPADRLMSPEADAAIAHSFDALSVSVAVQNSGVVENAVREMIRPMLKAWLDDHLPTMVENLVRAEIQRVARGGR
jgi:cell pole-organizing protein PopZ